MTEWLRYSNQNATRNKPLDAKLVSAMSFLPEMGISMEVFSGGQDAIGTPGGKRTGSIRHDHGEAGDVFFYQNGRKLDWANEQDQPIYAEIVRRGKERGVTGFGAGDGYMQPGSMHLGFGASGVWGKDGQGSAAPGWLRSAYGDPAPAQQRSRMERPSISREGYNLSTIEGYIRQSAQDRGMDPEIAVKVAKSEGLARNTYQSNASRNGVREPSFGPFQLLVGGGETGFPEGLGNRFMKDTGLDPRDPDTVYAQIDYALNEAGRVGWGQWYGAAKVGVGKFDGTRGAKSLPVDASFPGRGRKQSPTSVSFAQREGQEMGGEYRVGQQSTVTYADQQPITPYTNQEARALQPSEDDRASLWEGVKAAADREWSNPFKSMGSFAPDPNFRLTDELARELTKGMPEGQWGQFADANSEAHARAMRVRFEQAMESERKLDSMGASGTALRIAAGFTDPTAWAIGAGVAAASGGLGVPAYLGARFGRAGMAAEGAIVGAVGNAGSEAIRLQENALGSGSDVLLAAGAGMIFGGAFGAIARNPALAEEAAGLEKVGRDLKSGTALQNSSAGAAQASPKDQLRLDTDDFLAAAGEAGYDPKAAFGKARFDSAAGLKDEANPSLLRAVGNVLVEDGVRNADGTTPISASEVATRLNQKAGNNWSREIKPAFDAWRKEQGKTGFMQKDKAWAEFKEAVTDGARSADPMDKLDPNIARGVQAMRQNFKDWVPHMQNPGLIDGRQMAPLRGADKLHQDEFYVPRIPDLGAVTMHLDTYGSRQLRGLMAGAIKSKLRSVGTTVDEAVTDRVADAYIKRLHSSSAGDVVRNQGAFGAEDLDELKRLLQETGDVDEASLDLVLNAFRREATDPADAAARADRADQRGASSHLKHRLLFDEDFGAMLSNQAGTEQTFVRISDLFVKDADLLVNLYNRRTAGQVAMARTQIKNPHYRPDEEGSMEYLVDGIRTDAEYEKLKSQIRAVGDAEGVKAAHTDERLKLLDWSVSSIMGRPLYDEGSKPSRWLRNLRDYNFVRVMGQVGFAAISETANLVAQAGLKASFTNMPSFRSFWRNARTGKLDDALADEAELIFGGGTDVLRSRAYGRFDGYEDPLENYASSQVVNGMEKALHKGKHFVASASGLAPVNTMLQRWTQRAILNKFANMALAGEKVAGKRMQALGLTDDMVDRIGEQFRTHAKYDGKRLKAVNWKAWDDAEAAAAFEMGGFRLSRSIIQENDLGQMSRWMSSPTMRTVLQFRSFMLAAWSKQFLQGANHRDLTTMMAFTGSTFAASAAYTARTYLNSIGRGDRQEYLENKLSVQSIAAAGLQNSSWFTIMGLPVDVATWAAGADPVFNSRNTQLSSDPLFGNPTADLYQQGKAVFETGRHIVSGGRVARTDTDAIRKALPFQNMMGVAQIYSAMVSPLPEWRPKD